MSSTTGTFRDEEGWENLSSGRHSGLSKIRVLVVFGNAFFQTEKRIIVPTRPSTAVTDFLAEAVRRAQALGLALSSTEDLVLLTESEHGPIACGEDALADVLDPRETIVWLGNSGVGPHLSLTFLPSPTSKEPQVCYGIFCSASRSVKLNVHLQFQLRAP
jgi:hypothetical protein